MKFKLKVIYLSSFIFFIFIPKLYSQFQALETKHLRLVNYGMASSYLKKHITQSFELSLQFHQNIFDYLPKEKVTVLVHDIWDYGNAGALVIPKNQIILGIAPRSHAFETNPSAETIKSTMGHELVHIYASDKPAGVDNLYRSIFMGKVHANLENPISIFYSYLTNPRWYSPRWHHEGIAVFMETWMSGGLGRAQGSYDEMVFRTMVRDSSYIYDCVGLESEGTTIDFQVGVNSYLYGTRFVSYLAYQYGLDKLFQWYNRTDDSNRYFSSQFKKVYGTSLDSEWSRWISWEKEWQGANLQSIRKHATTNYRQISREALGAVSRAFYDDVNGKLYVAVKYPGQVAHIAAINIHDGKRNEICEVIGAAGYSVSALAYDPSSGTIFFTTGNNQWRDLNRVDIKTGKTERLIDDVRTGDFAFNQNDRSLWGVRHFNGMATLVRIPYPYQEWNKIYSYPYGEDIYDLDISPDGKYLIAALSEISGRQRLIKMKIQNLMEGDSSFIVLFEFGNTNPATFLFSKDGKYIYGSSYYSGVSNIYRYDFAKEDMSIISNCETGFFRPVPISNDSLVAFKYTGKGFVPVMLANQPLDSVGTIDFLGREIRKKYPVVENWTLGTTTSIDVDSITTFSGEYNQLSNIKLVSAYPIIEGYKKFASIGLYSNFLDRILLSGFDFTASYSPNTQLPVEERFHLGLKFHHWAWKIRASYNKADFYDLFGPTKRSRKGYSLGVNYNKTLLFDDPKTLNLTVDLAGYGGLERLPYYQNVEATFEDLVTASIGLDYKFVRQSLGAVDDEKGIVWSLMAIDNYVNTQHIFSTFTNFDYGILLPINHSSIWLRSSFGYSFGELNDPFANFFFGGFGNNWIDKLTEKRYREFYSFPGVNINEFGGKYYGKLMFEWNLPPIRFRRFGFPSLYCNWVRSALFTSLIALNLNEEEASKPYPQYGVRRVVSNLGTQLDFRLVLFSHFKSTFSIGYAAAFERNRKLSTEFMISLKIM